MKHIGMPYFLSVLLVSALLAGCGGAAERKAKYLERGQALYEQANYDKAQLELRNALQIDPKDVAARHLLGLILEEKQNYPAAANSYLAVIDADPHHVAARVRLGRLYLLGNVPDKAADMADKAFEREPNNADVLALRGGVRTAKGDLRGAVDDANVALKLVPGHLDAVALLAGIYHRQQQSDKALALLQDGIARNPASVALRVLLAEVHHQQGRHEQAAQALQAVVDREPAKLGHRVRLAAYYTANKRLDDAEKVLRDAVAQQASAPEPKLTLVNFLMENRGRQAAERQLIAFVEKEPKAYNLRFGLAQLHESTGDTGKAEQIYRDIVRQDGTNAAGLQARVHIAQLHFNEGKIADAEALVVETLDENKRDNAALILRGRIALARNDAGAAIGDFRTVLKDQPNSSDVLRLLAAAHTRNDERRLALESLSKAIEVNPRDLGARIQLGELLAQGGDANAAAAQYRAVLAADPRNLQALDGLFRMRIGKQEWREAEDVARRVREAYPNLGLGYYLAGALQQAQKKYTESVPAFEAALKRSPRAPEPLSGLASSYMALKQPDAALARARRAAEEMPDHAVAQNLTGEILLTQKKIDEAAAAFEKSIALEPRQPIGYKNLALTRLAKHDVASAEQVYRRGLDATGGDFGLRLELATLYQQFGKSEQAILEYEEILKRFPNSQVVANNLAMLLVTHRQDRKSIDRAAILTNRLAGSDNASFLDTLGWVRYQRGEIDGSIAVLEQALAKAPEEPLLRYHLGMAYYKKGDHVAALRHLQQAVKHDAVFHGRDDAIATVAKLGAS